MITEGKKRIRIQLVDLETKKSKSVTVYGVKLEKLFKTVKDVLK